NGIRTFDPAEIAKSGAKRRNATRLTGRGYKTQEADTSNLKRLRARRERPRRRCRAKKRNDELAPPHCLPRGSGLAMVPAKTATPEGPLMSALGQKRTFAPQ